MQQSPRLLAALAVASVVHEGRSLSTVLPPLEARCAVRDRALLAELSFGTIRWYLRLEALLALLLERPLKPRQAKLKALLLVGFHQLLNMRIPAHAAIHETVAAATALGEPHAKGLLNGVLRNLDRRRDELLLRIASDPVAATAHPAWLLNRLNQAWGDAAPGLFDANNGHPPFTLRIDRRRISREDYLQQLAAAAIEADPGSLSTTAITLTTACPVTRLPGFEQGLVSVQDEAAQLAATLLDPQPGERLLDACAAPGGKSAALLEWQPQLAELVALDIDQERLQQVSDNLQRGGLKATLITADALDLASWWDGRPFDRILLDAPCSATGVIRRHPDIKLLRRPTDIAPLASRQRALLEALWPTLVAGGQLLYATCSVLPAENEAVVAGFLADHPDAQARPLPISGSVITAIGCQLLPTLDGPDGFYYAMLHKRK